MPHPVRSVARRVAGALAACGALAAAAAPAAAQFAAPRPAPRPTTQTAAINLIGLPFGLVSGEYERAIGRDGLAFGVGGSTSFDRANSGNVFDDNGFGDENRFTSLQAKLKYYPSARGLRGFAVGVTAGVASSRGIIAGRLAGFDTVRVGGGQFYTQPRYDRDRVSLTRPTVGTVLDYNFLIGSRQRFLVGLGIGARRVIGSRRVESFAGTDGSATYFRTYGLDRTLFDGRLQVGFGF